jgi:hypothetical protein
VSDAYARFFRRTFANLEAVAEGRDVRIGRPWTDESEGEPLPVERLAGIARKLQADGDLDIRALLKGITPRLGGSGPTPARIDADGFRHFEGAAEPASPSASPVAGLLRDFDHAARIDAGAAE